jgi:hypothetical protein
VGAHEKPTGGLAGITINNNYQLLSQAPNSGVTNPLSTFAITCASSSIVGCPSSSVVWGSLRALRRFILRGPAPRGYNGDGESVEGTARAGGTAHGLAPRPCRESSFADKQ